MADERFEKIERMDRIDRMDRMDRMERVDRVDRVEKLSSEKKSSSRHTILLEQRTNAYLTGISDVISFDDETVIAETEKGLVIIKGYNLHVSKLNLDNGELNIDGDLSGFTYEDNPAHGMKNKSSLFGKIFK